VSDAYTIRPFVAADLPEVLDVMRLSLGESEVNRRTRELFGWKHFDNPFGRSIILIADAGGRIAGLRAFMRWELTTPSGYVVRAVRPVDTATHPDFRRMGIFRNLTMAALEEARADGVHLVFNTPNADSGAGYRSMGWKDVQPIGAFVRPKRPWRAAVEATVERSTFVPGGEKPLGLDTPDRPARGLRTIRSAAYRQWRFADHPTAGYRMVRHADGAVMLRPNVRNGRAEVVVSDLVGRASARAFRAAAAAADSHYLVSWFSGGSPERAASTSALFVPVPKLTALTQVALPLTDLDVDVFDPKSWDLATGDLELL
jgi:GNAT superfamily N-acetyltransferase